MTVIRNMLAMAAAGALCACGGDGNEAAPVAGNTAAPIAAVASPDGRPWIEVVEKTPEGGFRMGNPDARVKLVEYGSFTCRHCADFSVASSAPLRDKYIASGQVSFEFRNFIRDPLDAMAALLGRCQGPGPFFKLTEGIFADQQNWMASLMNLPKAEQQRLDTLPQDERLMALANATGLDRFLRQRGVPEARIKACLADEGAANELEALLNTAQSQYKVNGTPTFLLNGEVIGTATWETLEPRLRAAIG